jgi:hypothetical protein
MKFNVVWVNQPKNLTEEQTLYVAREIVWLEQLSKTPEDVIFHTIELSSNDEGPSVVVYGKPGNDRDLFLDYNEVSEFVHLERNE